jgi:hypothetical protein
VRPKRRICATLSRYCSTRGNTGPLFLFLAQFELRFVVIHLYQSVPYLAILILLYYRRDRFAYMIAMLVAGTRAYVSPLLSVAVRELVAFRSSDITQIAVSVLALVTTSIACR